MKRGEPRPGGRRPRPRTDAFLKELARLALSIYYRRVEVAGEDRIPATGPVVVVANHVNGMVDPALIAGFLPRMPRFLAMDALWRQKPLVPLLEAAGVTPVYRKQEYPGADPNRNLDTFAKSWELLAAGGVLALFPEGVSHSEPALQPMRTGAARIVLEAERVYGPLGIVIVPVGLIFDAKGKFRSRALVQAGDPIDPAPERAAYLKGDEQARREAVRDLTARVDQGLRAVTLSWGSWDESRLVARAATMWAQRRPNLPEKLPLSEAFGVQQAMLEGYAWMREHHPRRTASFVHSLAEYDQLLSGARLRDEQVAARYAPGTVLGFLGRAAAALLPLNLAFLGSLLNAAPYFTVRWIGESRIASDTATWTLYPALVAFPAFWLLQGVLAGLLAGFWIGVAMLIAAPVAGSVALAFHDTRRRLQNEARAWFMLRTRRRLAAQLAAKRQEVLDQLDTLAGLFQSEAGSVAER